MIRYVLLLALAAIGRAQADATAPAGPQPTAGPVVSVPTFPNSTCPIMGKKVSMKLFTDTEFGRIYICCKGCDKKILKDVATAYKTAYPTTKTIANTACPVTGEKLDDKAVAVTLQGHAFRVCCADCLPETQRAAQVVLARVTNDKLDDLRNADCPVTGEPIADNVFAVVADSIVRLSSSECVDAVKRNAAPALAKAKVLAAQRQILDPRQRGAAASKPARPADASSDKELAPVPARKESSREPGKGNGAVQQDGSA